MGQSDAITTSAPAAPAGQGLRRVLPGLAAIAAFCLMPGLTALQAGPINLVQDGSFSSYTGMGTYGGYICNSGTASSCVSNLTYWKSNCSTAAGTTGCNTSAVPSSLILNPGNGGSAWNGGYGFWSYSNPTSGNVVAIDGDPQYSTTLSQTITGLSVGNKYVLTFWQAAAQQSGLNGATTEQWKVSFGAQSFTSTLMNNANHGFVAWNQQTMTFVATATTQTLSFLSLGTPGGQPPVSLLNSVSMVDIPEPGSLGLMTLGLGALFARRRRARLAA